MWKKSKKNDKSTYHWSNKEIEINKKSISNSRKVIIKLNMYRSSICEYEDLKILYFELKVFQDR